MRNRKSEMDDESVKERERERETVKSQSAWEIRGDGEKELREKKEAQIHVNSRRGETVRDTDPNVHREADFREVQANSQQICSCRSLG